MANESSVLLGLITAFREHYEVIRETGRGGSATVYLARDLKHDRFVAIKVLNPDLGVTSGDRFLREIQVSAGMQHPHILPTYDSGVADGRLYFVMPFVDGGSLRQRLETASSLPIEDALRIARDIGVALHHAHSIGIIHRDVKPENIMFYHGTACLADFGVARAIEEMDPGLTVHGAVVGTPAYMSPEQYSAVGFDGRSDVYSLTCVLYEMIAGARLYSGSTVKDVLAERAKPPSIRKLRPKIPEFVDDLLNRGLAPLPEERFADARALVAAIDDALKQITMPMERISGPRRALNNVKQHRLAYGIATAAIFLTAGFAWPPLRLGVVRFASPLGSEVNAAARVNYVDGRIALDAWDIPAAQKSLAAAVAADPHSPSARLWHAESFALARQFGEDFRVAAMRLGTLSAQLHGRDSLLALGLYALAMGQQPTACQAYAAQLRADSLDVLAWYGMGDCQSLDSSVVVDRASPSGYRFQSSFYAASRAYMRAVTIEPNAHAAFPYSALTRLLPSDVAYVRFGRILGPPPQSFMAYPMLAGDTIGFIPYPLELLAAVTTRTISPTHVEALRRNRDFLLAFARQWTAAAPNNPDAWEALALAREGRGEIADGDDNMMTATQRSLSLSTATLQQARLVSMLVRTHVKRTDFARARVLSDSLLASWKGVTPSPEVAGILSGLAALTGRLADDVVYKTATGSARAANLGISPPLYATSNKFWVRAISGVCDDSLGITRREFERALVSYAQPRIRPQVRQTVLSRGSMLAYPCLRSQAFDSLPSITPHDRAQRAHNARNNRLARAIVDSLRDRRVGYKPGDISIDINFVEASLRASAGDTTGAERQLDLVLDALPTVSALTVRDDGLAASLVRAMILRADLASARRDSATARRWAGAVVDLWSGADAALQPTVARMKTIAGR